MRILSSILVIKMTNLNTTNILSSFNSNMPSAFAANNFRNEIQPELREWLKNLCWYLFIAEIIIKRRMMNGNVAQKPNVIVNSDSSFFYIMIDWNSNAFILISSCYHGKLSFKNLCKTFIYSPQGDINSFCLKDRERSDMKRFLFQWNFMKG